MLRFAFGLAAFYLGWYPFAIQRFSWLGWFHPRGGIIGLALYLVLAIGLILRGRGSAESKCNASIRSSPLPQPRDERFQALLGGWLLLLMPPLWWFVIIWAS